MDLSSTKVESEVGETTSHCSFVLLWCFKTRGEVAPLYLCTILEITYVFFLIPVRPTEFGH